MGILGIASLILFVVPLVAQRLKGLRSYISAEKLDMSDDKIWQGTGAHLYTFTRIGTRLSMTSLHSDLLPQ